MPSIKLPDGSVRAVPEGSTVLQVAESIGKRLAQAAVVGKVDGKLVDVSARIPEGEHTLQIITDRDPEGLLILRHSTAHVMAEAIQRLWPDAQLAYGPPLENGFYYDIALPAPRSTNDLRQLQDDIETRSADDARPH